MNERIKKLAEQAGYWTTEKFLESENKDMLEKFAELIIRECAGMITSTDLEDVEGGDSAVLYAAASQLNQHFGVK